LIQSIKTEIGNLGGKLLGQTPAP